MLDAAEQQVVDRRQEQIGRRLARPALGGQRQQGFVFGNAQRQCMIKRRCLLCLAHGEIAEAAGQVSGRSLRRSYPDLDIAGHACLRLPALIRSPAPVRR